MIGLGCDFFLFILYDNYREEVVILLTILLLGILVCNVFIKKVIKGQRTCWIDSGFKLLVNVPKDYSFPSGHTLASFVSCTILALIDV